MVDSIKKLIRDIPDFPKPGILFHDITPLLADPSGLALAVELLANPFRGKNIDLVVGAESRGFIFGTAGACCLSAGLVPVRNPGKLPHKKQSITYDLEYGSDTLEMHSDAIVKGQRVLVIDDQNPLAFDDGVGMHFERVGAVLQVVGDRLLLVRQLARVTDGDEAGGQAAGAGGAEDEAAAFGSDDKVDILAAERIGEQFDRQREARRIGQ